MVVSYYHKHPLAYPKAQTEKGINQRVNGATSHGNPVTGKVGVGEQSQRQLTAVANPAVVKEELVNLYRRPADAVQQNDSKKHFDSLVKRERERG